MLRFHRFARVAAVTIGIGLVAPLAARADDAEKVVNIYSSRHYPSDDQIYQLFTKQTGIQVKAIQGKAEELMERIRLEGESSPADLFITVDAGNLWRAEEDNLLQPIQSKELEDNVPANLRDPQGRWFAFSERARVIIYDKTKVKVKQLSTYEALADPKWQGNILVRSSNNIYNQSLVAAMIDSIGEEKTEAWAKGLVENFARKPQGGDIEQIKALVGGEGTIAISNTYYFARLLAGKDEQLKKSLRHVGVFFPNQEDRGTHINISGAGVVVNAPHKDNAVKFLEFLVSPDIQRLMSDINFEYPVRPDVPPTAIIAAWGPFKADSLHVSALGKNNPEAVELMDRVGWRSPAIGRSQLLAIFAGATVLCHA
ncbi:MAG: Fe(3+) ABC transporter substrate-binding protein [Dongiaceae bacterium]